MTRRQNPTARKTFGGIQRLRDRIPSMTDAELVTLRGNAERLSKVAEEAIEEDQKQVTTAREVMSLVDVEVGDRKLKKKSSHPAAVEKSPRRGSAKAGV